MHTNNNMQFWTILLYKLKSIFFLFRYLHAKKISVNICKQCVFSIKYEENRCELNFSARTFDVLYFWWCEAVFQFLMKFIL